MGGSSKRQTVGYRYYFDMHFGLGLPCDEIVEIRADDKTAWRGSITDNGQVRINAPQLFGGDKGEGGLDGTLDVMFGEEDQTVVARLRSMLGGICPAFRGITTAFYSGLVTSVNPYPKTWDILRRGGNRTWGDKAPWYPERQFIWLADHQIKAMNPVHILYQIHTSDLFRGWPTAWMDDTSWRAAADTCYNEELGLCLEWKRSDSFATFRDTVLNHISGDVYDDPKTGLCCIKLLRDDYDVDDLPVFTPDTGLLEITDEDASTTDVVPSEVLVKYTDAITGDTQQVRACNAAVAARAGGRTSETVEYLGAPTGEIAGRLALRELRIKTSGLKRFTVVLDRRGSSIEPNGVFIISDNRRGLSQVVLRAGKIESGTMTDGRVTITALQDVFGLPTSTFVAVPAAGWSRPDRTPQAIATQRLMELPYREIAGTMDLANLRLLDGTEAYMAALAVAPTTISLGYDLLDRVGNSGDFVNQDAGDWCPTGLLISAIGKTDTEIQLTDSTRFSDIETGTAALVDDELVRIDAIDDDTGIITIARGCMDTVPVAHEAGARIWFYDGFAAADSTEYTAGITLQAKLLTKTSEGTLDEDLAATASLALQGRQGLPYPPGRVRINDEEWPSEVTGDIVLTWAHRDRLNQADQIIDTQQGSIGPESGVTYSVQLLQANDEAVLVSQTGITGTTATLTTDYEGDVILELWSEKDGMPSWQRHRTEFTVAEDLSTN